MAAKRLRKPDDADAVDADAVDVAALLQKLGSGAVYGDGADVLTGAECRFLIEVWRRSKPPPRRRGPKPDPNLSIRDRATVTLIALYEADGMPTEAAVAKVMQHRGVSRSKVYDAQRQHPVNLKPLPPNVRASLIDVFERLVGAIPPFADLDFVSPVGAIAAQSLDGFLNRLQKSN
jgi:hypothetical protein